MSPLLFTKSSLYGMVQWFAGAGSEGSDYAIAIAVDS